MIITTTDIKRPYKILRIVSAESLDDMTDANDSNLWVIPNISDTDAIIGVRITRDSRCDLYDAYGTAVKFK